MEIHKNSPCQVEKKETRCKSSKRKKNKKATKVTKGKALDISARWGGGIGGWGGM